MNTAETSADNRLPPAAFRHFHGALLAVSLVLLCGCPATPPKAPAPARPLQGQEVELLVPASLRLPTVWEVVLNEWMDGTGATIRFSEYSAEEAPHLEKKLAAPAPSGGRIVLFPLRQLSELETHLAPIEDVGESLDLKDLFRGLKDRVVSRNRSVVAIPVAAPVLLCYYRADLLKAAGLKPPETWEEYQQLLDSLDRWAPGKIAVEPLAPGYRSTLFYARALAYAKHPENYSVWFDLDSDRPLLATPGFEEALESASRAWKKMPPAIAELMPADCRNKVLDGTAALAIGMEPVAGLGDKVKRAEAIEIGVCRLPGSRRVYNPNSRRWDESASATVHAPALCGFDGMALGVGATSKSTANAAAWHLLSTLAGEQFESNWAALPKSPCRESQVVTASTWHESGLTLEESSKGGDAIAQSLRDSQVVAEFPLPGAAEFRRATEVSIGKVLQDNLDPAAAIQQLQKEFEQIVTQVGADAIRSGYRRGLGLPPATR